MKTYYQNEDQDDQLADQDLRVLSDIQSLLKAMLRQCTLSRSKASSAAGIEPANCGITVRRSTDCATLTRMTLLFLKLIPI